MDTEGGRGLPDTAVMHDRVKRTACILMLMLGVWIGEGKNPAYGQDNDPRAVRVIPETLIVYAQMSENSARVATLKKGMPVILRLQITGSEGAWCAITARDMARITGYVLCEHLDLGRRAPSHWSRVDGAGDESAAQTTHVMIIGNLVLVPATVGYNGNTTEVWLLLDTGASRTVLSAEVASRLRIDLTQAERATVRVVGGARIEARRETLSFLTVGPHTKTGLEVVVIHHTGPAVKHDGLLGIDVLRNLNYTIDYKNKVIRWQAR